MITRRHTGFTLLELLLALTMAATIAGSLAASLYVAYRARNSVDAAIDAAHMNDAVGDIITRDLVNAVPPNTNFANGTFTGYTDSIEFCASGGDSRSTIPGDLKLVEFAVTNDPVDPSANILVRRVTTNLLPAIEAEPVDETICRNVQEFTLSYYDGTSWYETWDATEHDNTLPFAIELKIVQASSENPEDVREIVRQIALPCGVAVSSTTTGGG